MAPSTKTLRPGAESALEAEAAESNFVTFTVKILGVPTVDDPDPVGTDLDLTVLRDPMKLGRHATKYLGARDPYSVSALTEILLGSEQLAKVDELNPTIEDLMNITVAWSEANGTKGK